MILEVIMISIKIKNLNTKDISQKFDLEIMGENLPILFMSKISFPTAKPKNTVTYLNNLEHFENFKDSGIKILITKKGMIENHLLTQDICYIFSPNPEKTFTEISNYIFENNLYEKIEKKINKFIDIDSSSFISNNTKIGKNVKIGKNCVINENSILKDNVTIGDNCVIGSSGLNVLSQKGRDNKFTETIGGVIIENDVRVENFVNISKGTGGRFTKINNGSILGSFVNIGHDSYIGKNSIIIDGTKLSGHVSIGDEVYLGINTTVLQNIKIGSYSKTGIGTVVTNDIKENTFVIGNPGRNIS